MSDARTRSTTAVRLRFALLVAAGAVVALLLGLLMGDGWRGSWLPAVAVVVAWWGLVGVAAWRRRPAGRGRPRRR